MTPLNLANIPAAAYPNRLLRDSSKKGHAWIKQMAQAYLSEVFRSQQKMWFAASDHYAELLSYALGKQSTKQYERWRTSDDGSRSTRATTGVDGWVTGDGAGSDGRNLSDVVDQSPLPVLPIKLRALEALLDERGYDPTVTVIGPRAEQELRTLVDKVRLAMTAGKQMEGAGIPQPPDLPADIPQDETELQMFLEDLQLDASISMEEKQAICLEESNYEQLASEVRQDLLRYGLACLTDFQQPGKRPLVKRVPPNRGLFLPSAYPDCRDWWAGAYMEAITIEQLRAEVAAGRALDPKAPDVDWDQIKSLANASLPDTMKDLDPEMGTRLDTGAVRVVRVYFLSDDDEVQQTKATSKGNLKTYAKKPGFKNESGTGTVTRRTLSNVYEATLVEGTDIAYNCRLAVEQKRDLRNPLQGRLPFAAYVAGQLDGHAVSLVDYTRSIINDMERSIRMWRTDMKTYVPEGFNIPRAVLKTMAAMNGKDTEAGEMEAYKFFLKTGTTFGDNVDEETGNPTGIPVSKNPGGVPQSANQHWTDFWNSMQLLEMVTGANAVASASTPNAEMGKAVANMALQGAQNVLKYLFRAQESLHGATFRNLAARIKYTEHRNPVVGALPLHGGGAKTVGAFPDLNKYEFVTGVEIRPTPEEWQRIEQKADTALQSGITGSPDGIDYEDYLAIFRHRNLKKAQRDLARRIKRRRKRLMEESAAQQQNNGAVQTQSIQAKATADEQFAAAQHARKMEELAYLRGTQIIVADKQVNAAFAQKELESVTAKEKTLMQEDAETQRIGIREESAQQQLIAQQNADAESQVREAMLAPEPQAAAA